jgi:hypothetical protein
MHAYGTLITMIASNVQREVSATTMIHMPKGLVDLESEIQCNTAVMKHMRKFTRKSMW